MLGGKPLPILVAAERTQVLSRVATRSDLAALAKEPVADRLSIPEHLSDLGLQSPQVAIGPDRDEPGPHTPARQAL